MLEKCDCEKRLLNNEIVKLKDSLKKMGAQREHELKKELKNAKRFQNAPIAEKRANAAEDKNKVLEEENEKREAEVEKLQDTINKLKDGRSNEEPQDESEIAKEYERGLAGAREDLAKYNKARKTLQDQIKSNQEEIEPLKWERAKLQGGNSGQGDKENPELEALKAHVEQLTDERNEAQAELEQAETLQAQVMSLQPDEPDEGPTGEDDIEEPLIEGGDNPEGPSTGKATNKK